MLQSVLCYLKGDAISTRWAIIEGDDDFFVLTKRIHHFLHGSDGDGDDLGDTERASYMRTLEREGNDLYMLVRSDDVVVLHDPQTLGFAPMLRQLGARIVWSCHVGTDEPNEFAWRAWNFLSPYACLIDRIVFSRRKYAWDQLDPTTVEIIPP